MPAIIEVEEEDELVTVDSNAAVKDPSPPPAARARAQAPPPAPPAAAIDRAPSRMPHLIEVNDDDDDDDEDDDNNDNSTTHAIPGFITLKFDNNKSNINNTFSGKKRKAIKPMIRKKVRFARELEQVHELPPIIVESQNDNKPVANGNNNDTVTSTQQQQQRRTSQITILSSLHGRARRLLRKIDKHDLQAAIKYGTKAPAKSCHRTGAKRWKYTYGNIVYITDESSKKEITSWKQSITIPRATIYKSIQQQHLQQKQTLQHDDPQLCTTHSIIIIDQSGSMKNSDTQGFRNRSEAAYGILALDYIAEQLHERDNAAAAAAAAADAAATPIARSGRGANDNHDDNDNNEILDAVTIIEMNDTSRVLYYREPLDWVLFNKLLDRQTQAIPRSHGNYYDSLLHAKHVIDKELRLQQVKNVGGGGFGTAQHDDNNNKNSNSNNDVSDDIDLEDLPSISLVFLSDGRPSDSTPTDTAKQNSVLSKMATDLQDNFSFHAIGLGPPKADFAALKRLTTIVQDAGSGSTATFAVSTLSCVKLGQAFSDVASSVTTSRMNQFSMENHNNTSHGRSGKRIVREKKNVKIRSRSVPNHERKFQRYSNDVSIWKYDHSKFEAKDSWPWTKTNFKNSAATGFDMEKDPFGRGGERLAYMFYEVGKHGRHVGNKAMVAKETTYIDYDEERKITFHETFCRSQFIANQFAEQFNKAVKRSEALRPIFVKLKTPDIRFLDCFIYEYPHPDGTIGGVLVEDYLEGKFTKYNSNAGYVRRPVDGDSTIQLVVGTVYMTDFLQAFSHWVYVQTDHQLLVCDLQGILNEEGRNPRFDLTDPCICSKGKRGRKQYGASNIGTRGFRCFKKSHKCNDVCKGLGLPSFGVRTKASLS